MSAGPSFLGGARGRLLPRSIPFRYFGAAVVFHIAGWLALAIGAEQWARAPTAAGWPLAALHLITLGVLVTSAMGAGAQLLPVASGQPAPPARALAAIWWLQVGGVVVLCAAMALVRPAWLAAGAAALTLALGAWTVLIARNLRGARGMSGVVWHAWAALVLLLVAIAAAWGLVAAWNGGAPQLRGTWLALHRLAAPWGFMGLLALGIAYILVPMFALADAPPDGRQRAVGAAAVVALGAALLAGAGLLRPASTWIALVAGAGAVVAHLALMAAALRTGMQRRLGPSFVLIRLGWLGLAASIGLGVAAWTAPAPRWLGPAFGLALIGGWLLSFVLGVLERIVPFLGAMHAAAAVRRAPTATALTHETALRLHAAAHVAALTALAAGIGLDSAAWVRAGAAVGTVGAVAFGWAFLTVLRRLPEART